MIRSIGLAALVLWLAGAGSGLAQGLLCKYSFDASQKKGDSGSSLRLDYNVDGQNAFNGFWMKLGPADRGNNFDVSDYRMLTLWVRGDPASGIPTRFKVELKGDQSDVIGQFYITDVGKDWRKIEIPLEIFAKQGVQLAALNEMTVGFERKAAIPTLKGSVWIDEIMLEGDGEPRLVADFNSSDANNLGGKWGTYTP